MMIGPMGPPATNAAPGDIPLAFWWMALVLVLCTTFAFGFFYGLWVAGRGGDEGWGRGPDDREPKPPDDPDPGGLKIPDTIPFWMHVEEDLRRMTVTETRSTVG